MLAGFWTFPLTQIESIESITGQQLNIKPVTHIFTHRRWEIWLVKQETAMLNDNQQYFSSDEWSALSLPKVQHKLLEKLYDTEF